MKIISYVIALAIIVVGVTFASLNAEQVVFNYYFGAAKLSLSFLLVAAVVFGVMTAMLLLMRPVLKLKTANMRLKSRVKHAEQEVANLRAIPIKDSH